MLLSETDPFLGLKQIFLIYSVRALENWNYWIVLAISQRNLAWARGIF